MGYFSDVLRKRFSRGNRDHASPEPSPSSAFGCSSLTGRESFIRRKLSIFRRKKSSVAPTATVVVPGPSSSGTASLNIVHRTADTSRSPPSTPRPSLGFLGRRLFSGAGRNRATVTLSTQQQSSTHQPPTSVVLLNYNNNSAYRGPAQTNYRPQQQRWQRESSVSLPLSTATAQTTVSVAPRATTPPPSLPLSPPKGIGASSNTGTISKLSSSANCTRGFKNSITVRIVSVQGGLIDVTLPMSKTGKELLLEAIGRFAVDAHELLPLSSPTNFQDTLAKCKLVTMDTREAIDKDQTLERLGLRNGGEWEFFLLLGLFNILHDLL